MAIYFYLIPPANYLCTQYSLLVSVKTMYPIQMSLLFPSEGHLQVRSSFVGGFVFSHFYFLLSFFSESCWWVWGIPAHCGRKKERKGKSGWFWVSPEGPLVLPAQISLQTGQVFQEVGPGSNPSLSLPSLLSPQPGSLEGEEEEECFAANAHAGLMVPALLCCPCPSVFVISIAFFFFLL